MKPLAVAVLIASVALAIVSTVLAVLNLDTPTPRWMSMGSKIVEVGFPLGALTLAATGLFIALRHPRHPVAWSYLLSGLGTEMLLALRSYGLYGTTTAPGAPAAEIVLWSASWFLPIPICGVLFAFFLFPSGRLPSSRWRPLVWITIAAILTLATAHILGAPVERPDVALDVPFGPLFPPASLVWLSDLGTVIWVAAIIGTGLSVLARFFSAHGDERQQLKWFAYAMTIAVVISLAQMAFALLRDSRPELSESPVLTVLTAMTPTSVLLMPTAAAAAILRYRLYEIDVVIERTLVYGVVSATLGILYWSTVVMLQGPLSRVAGGSEAAIAVSTLVVVALFQPIRGRVQDAVDRRFYRARYDATRATEAFIARLRDDVELDSIRAHLIDVVDSTVHPAYAGVWLRDRR